MPEPIMSSARFQASRGSLTPLRPLRLKSNAASNPGRPRTEAYCESVCTRKYALSVARSVEAISSPRPATNEGCMTM